MKILMSWLRDYIDIEETPERIADALLMAGIEVESISQPGKSINNVVVGKILSREKHPNADKLSVCQVTIGKGDPMTIVCGAPNCDAEANVPVALIGATLPGGLEIRKAKIRGVESSGMLCSEREMGLTESQSGLLHLSPDAPLGENIVSYLNLDDVVLEVAVTPNRGDVLSHLGVARELSAIFQIPLKIVALDETASEGECGKITSVTMDAPLLCPRYGAKIIEGVQVGPSPRWLKERLERIGMRSINNVVDVTNYVLMDIGHPMHAFDLDTLEGRRIVVRNARQGEKIRSLDNVERSLDPNMLVIADAEAPVALAGVMGGQSTEVTAQTKNLLLEAAYFDPICIRRTAKALGMMSESSYRFERGTNIESIPVALNMATRHILAVAGGKARSGMVDGYPEATPQKTVLVRRRRVEQVLGISLTTIQIEALLRRLQMELKRNGEDVLVSIPPFRHDLEQEVDIIEEIARIHGYEHIPTTLPAISGLVMPPDPVTDLGDRIRDYLISQGFCQALNYSFIPSKVADLFHEGLPIKLLNPLSEDQSVLRTSLVWGMYDSIVRNVHQDEYDIKMFEVGRVFHRDGSEGTEERVRLCIGICGRWNPGDWRHYNDMVDTYHLKGIMESLSKKVGRAFEFKTSAREYYHPTDQMEIRCQSQLMGHGGRVHPKLLDNPKIPRQFYLIEIDLSALAKVPAPLRTMKPIPGFPAIRRDLALVVPPEVTAGQLKTLICEEGGQMLESVKLFDVYQGKNVDANERSLAFGLVFRARDRTLTDAEVQPRIDAVIARVESQFRGKLRG